MLQEHLGTEYEITNIFKPNAPLPEEMSTWRNLIMTLPRDIILL
jgi:hypothetical protein